MFELRALLGTLQAGAPVGLELALSELTDGAPVMIERDWHGLLEKLERAEPDLLVLDRRFWRECSDRRLRRIPTYSPATRIMMFAEVIDIAVVREAIAYGVHGCLPIRSSATQWVNAIQVVMRCDIAMPRKVLAEALAMALQQRFDDRQLEPLQPAVGKPLTDREGEVIQCVQHGMTNDQISRHLGITTSTVKTHLHHVFGKLGISRRILLAPGIVVQAQTSPSTSLAADEGVY